MIKIKSVKQTNPSTCGPACLKTVLDYLSEQNIRCCGRFAEFQYMNSDQVVEHTIRLAKELNAES